MTTAAETARAIRKELKEKFPNIKFSVRSQNFSMGNAVDVNYTDGVPVEEVEAILYKYEYGRFNAMEDMYEITNRREDVPQVKYVTVQRSISKEIREQVKAELAIRFDIENPEDDNEWMKACNLWPQQMVWKELQNKTLA